MNVLRKMLNPLQQNVAMLSPFNVADLVLLKAVVAAVVEIRVPVIDVASEGERHFLGTYKLAALLYAINGKSQMTVTALAPKPDFQRKDGKDLPEAIWRPHEKHGHLTTQSGLPGSVYVLPEHAKNHSMLRNMCVTQSSGSSTLSMSPMPTVLSHSRTSARLQTITTSISRRRHGTTWVNIPNSIEESSCIRRPGARTPRAGLRIVSCPAVCNSVGGPEQSEVNKK